MQVLKHDGRLEAWNPQKVIEAMRKASNAVGDQFGETHLRKLCGKVSKLVMDFATKNNNECSVKQVHTFVEQVLMSANPDVARAYIEFRSERDRVRESEGKLYTDVLGFIERTSDEYFNENANKAAGVVSTHRDLLAGILSKHLALTQILPPDVAEAHKKGIIHQHDNDYCLSPLTNCLLVNYRDMLAHGFTIGDARIESPNSIGVAATVLTQIAQAVAGSTYGGQSHCHIDTGLKPYVFKSWCRLLREQEAYRLPDEYIQDKLEKEVYDAMQCFLYQINSLTTTNGQTPFITISLGLDTSPLGRMITRNYLKVHHQGLGKDHITPAFPKVVFFLQEGVNMYEGDPNYDLKQEAVMCSVDRIYPDYVSVPRNAEITGSSIPVTPMGCRSFLSMWRDEYGNERLDGRFNLGVVSINLPYIALLAKHDIKKFYELLNKYAELCYKAHMARVERLKGTKAKQNPIMWMHGAIARLNAEDEIEPLFYGGRASISIGYIGLSETVQILRGEVDKDFAMEILSFLKDKCAEFKERSNLGFSMYGTPAESLCYSAAKAIKRDFGDDAIPYDFITNSFHVPVWEKTDPMHKWGYEQGFDELSSGGNIVYVEQPNLHFNLQAYEGLLNYAYKTGMHYFAVNTPVDQCFKCGYHGEFTATADGYVCPQCGNTEPGTLSVLRRVSGYISAPNSRPFNYGKQQEVMNRVKHSK